MVDRWARCPPAKPQIKATRVLRWRSRWPVADALQDPEDTCIIEGFPAYDPALEGIAVYALQVTTKQPQQARRAARPPEP